MALGVGEFLLNPVVTLGLEFEGQALVAALYDAAVIHHVHVVRHDVVEEALVVGESVSACSRSACWCSRCCSLGSSTGSSRCYPSSASWRSSFHRLEFRYPLPFCSRPDRHAARLAFVSGMRLSEHRRIRLPTPGMHRGVSAPGQRGAGLVRVPATQPPVFQALSQIRGLRRQGPPSQAGGIAGYTGSPRDAFQPPP